MIPPTDIRRIRLVGTLLTVVLHMVCGGALAAAGDDLETIRARLVAPLLVAPRAESVSRLIAAMQPTGVWPDIDYANRSRSSWTVPRHLSRVRTLACAYRVPNSAFHNDRRVLAAALTALDAWLRLDPQNPNWWWNQIGVPKTLLPILLLLDDDLSDARRAKALKILRRAKIGMTGQNLVWVTEITAGRGLLARDPRLVARAYQRIGKEIRIGQGEGIQPDFSFHQHGPCLYSHGYGAAFIADCTRIAVLLDGTDLAFPAQKIDVLTRLILDGTQWMTRGSATDFGAEGREITRKGQSTSHLVSAARNMLQLKTGREAEFEALLARATGAADAPPLVGNRHFWRADLMTHHRPAYYASARMHSTRLANTDGPANSEGLLSHHLADGCFVLMQTGREYRDIFGVWNWQQIPGTTVRQKPRLTGSPRRMGTTDFVGGVSDGTYGLAAGELERDGLYARKSWFFFDNEIVCLGAAVTAPANGPVLTTLNQCHLNGDVILHQAGETTQLDRGEHAWTTADWLWHDSVAYVLLEPARLCLLNDSRSGSWHASNRRYPDRQEQRDLFTAWIDHGTAPQGATYAYLVAPAIAQDQVADCATRTVAKVLANTERLQAVLHHDLGLVAAAFYRPGSVELEPGYAIQVDEPCLLLAQPRDGTLRITLANPRNTALRVALTVRTGQDAASARRVVVDLPGGPAAGSSVTRSIDCPTGAASGG